MLKRGFGAAILAASALAALHGLLRHSPFRPHPWPADGARTFGIFAVVMAGAFLLSRWLGGKFRVSPVPILLGHLVLEALVFYGGLPVLSVGLFLGSSYALGYAALTLAAREPEPDPLLALLSGMALYALLFCWLSPLPVNTLPTHYGLTGAILLAVLWKAGAKLPAAVRQIGFARAAEPVAAGLAPIGLFLCGAVLLAVGAAPEAAHDSLAMHLYIPSYMYGHARWSYDPMLYAFSFIPAAVDFLYAHLFLLGGEGAARLFNVFALFLTAFTAWRLALASGSGPGALLATLIFLSLPLAFIESANLCVENSLALWVTGAAYAAVVSRGDTRARGIAVGACVGAACATKLFGLVAAPFLLGAAVVFTRPRTAASLARFAACSLPGAALGAFPYGFAWLKIGNPVYPFYNDIFRAPFFPVLRFVDTRWTDHLDWSFLYDATFFSSRYLESADGVLGLSWLALLPFGLFAIFSRRDKAAAAVCLVALAAILASCQTVQYLRYLYPFLPLLCTALAFALSELDRLGRGRLATPLAALLIGAQVWLWPTGFDPSRSAPAKVLSPRERENFVRIVAPARLANQLVNEIAAGDPRVLYTERPQGGLLTGTAIYVNWYSQYFHWYAGRVADDETAAKFLEIAGVNFVVQPKLPTERFARVMGDYLSRTRRPLAEFGDLLVYGN